MKIIQVVFLLPKSCLCITTRCYMEHGYVTAYMNTLRGFGRNRQWPRKLGLPFQTIMQMSQTFSKNVGSTALCSFSALEGLTHCTDYPEYAPLRVSPSCWTLGLDLFWIPGDILISVPLLPPHSDPMK